MTITPHFSPADNIEQTIADAIAASVTSIYVVAYEFKSSLIEAALETAKSGGKTVEAIFDQRHTTNPASRRHALAASGVPCWANPYLGRMHSTYLIIDATIVIVGTAYLDRHDNEESTNTVVVLSDATTATAYKANFDLLKATSTELTAPGW